MPGRGDTRGSETSQYPEEKKSTEIPRVAASERGGAQTSWVRKPAGVARGGLRDAPGGGGGLLRELQNQGIAEEVWKGPP